MKDFKIKIIVLIVLIVIGILVSEWVSYESANEWNNGICSNCGGSWEYQQTITRGKYKIQDLYKPIKYRYKSYKYYNDCNIIYL